MQTTDAAGLQHELLVGELRPHVDAYLQRKLVHFGQLLCRQISPNFQPSQIDLLIKNSLKQLAEEEQTQAQMRTTRLVLRHDCQSTGCGDKTCVLCEYNPSRLCTRNLRPKYLIDDHLRAKCNAPLRVELVDERNNCHEEGLPPGVQLELHVLNGEKYKELCPDNTLLTLAQIRNCIISHHTKALLRREGMADDQVRVFLPLERGQAPLSDLSVTTSSEALLSGKAPTFRLLVWAVDASGEPVTYVTYVVSESFVVATKRVKGAIKSDIPSIADNVSKLNHIGKATVDKLADLNAAKHEEGIEVQIPESLNRIEKVGQFRELVQLCERNPDFKNKIRTLLKLSPEKWDDVTAHAMSAVVPDVRNRVWWCPAISGGLLFACKNGAAVMEMPIGVVQVGPNQEHTVVPIGQLSPNDFALNTKLKNQAIAAWYQTSHPQWQIYEAPVPNSTSQPQLPQLPPLSPLPPQQDGLGGHNNGFDAFGNPAQGYNEPYQEVDLQALLQPTPSQIFLSTQAAAAAAAAASSGSVAAPGAGANPATDNSPFAATSFMNEFNNAFPAFPIPGLRLSGPAAGAGADGQGGTGGGGTAGPVGVPQRPPDMATANNQQHAVDVSGMGGGAGPGLTSTQHQGASTATAGTGQGDTGNAGMLLNVGAHGLTQPPPPSTHHQQQQQHHHQQQGHGQQTLGNFFPSLEMLKTEDLLNFQGSLVGDPMRSADWLRPLHNPMDDAPSLGMNGGPSGVMHMGGGAGGAPSFEPGQLSTKFSMSLDLDGAVNELADDRS